MTSKSSPYDGREAEGLQVTHPSTLPEVFQPPAGLEVHHGAYKDAPEVYTAQDNIPQAPPYSDAQYDGAQYNGSQYPLNAYPKREQSQTPLMAGKEPWNTVDEEQTRRRRICGLPMKWFWALLALIGIIIVAIAVGAGVGVSTSKHSNTTSSTAPISTSTPTSPTSTPTPPTTSDLPISNTSRIAAVAYQDTNNITQSRVYYQDPNNAIKQSSWNATSGTWYMSNANITMAKAGTAIASSAYTVTTDDNNAVQINLFYFSDAQNTISYLISHDGGLTWSIPPNLPSASLRRVDADSKLATAVDAHYTCTTCTNSTILSFQNNSMVSSVNISAVDGSWDFTSKGFNAPAAAGTDISMFYWQNRELRVWFQDQEQQLHFFAWPDSNGTGWIDRNFLVQNLIPLTPLAAFNYFAPGTDSADFYQIVYFQSETTPPLTATGWANIVAPNSTDWTAAYSPPKLAGFSANSTLLAATEAKKVYTLVGTDITEWSVDGTSPWIWSTWTELGSVPTS